MWLAVTEPFLPEPVAQRILAQAIAEDRASEFLHCLFDGGSCTVDAVTGTLVLINGEQVKQLSSGGRDDDD
jgi:hypothetical protein